MTKSTYTGMINGVYTVEKPRAHKGLISNDSSVDNVSDMTLFKWGGPEVLVALKNCRAVKNRGRDLGPW